MKTITQHKLKRFSFSVLFITILSLTPFPGLDAHAQENTQPEQSRWSFLTGYGSSYPGWGETETRVETIDLLLRYGRVMIHDMGSSWYHGYHSLLVEPVVHLLTHPDESPMLSLNFLGCYTFTADEFITPYIFGGGGPVYVGGDITGIGARWNGNYQFGIGVKWKLNSTHSLLFEIRYHHLSNGNREEPNIPLNSAKFLAGFTF